MRLAARSHASESSAGFFLAGRQLTWPVIGASLFATNIGAEHLVGLSGDANRYGLCAATVELTTAICLGFACSILFPYYLPTEVFTIPEFLELRYNRVARTFFSCLMLAICIMTKMAFHLYAGALVLHGLLGWRVMPVVALTGAVMGTAGIQPSTRFRPAGERRAQPLQFFAVPPGCAALRKPGSSIDVMPYRIIS